MKLNAKLVASTVVGSLFASLLPGPAMAAPSPVSTTPVRSVAAHTDPDAALTEPDDTHIDPATAELMARASELRAGMSATEVAEVLFPDDEAARQQYVEEVNQVVAASAGEPGGPTGPRAVPAALAVFIPLLARCMWGALSAAAVNEIITLVHKGQTANAESRLYAVVGGCITGVIPSPLRWLANRAKSGIVKATLWLIVQLGPKR